MSEGDARVAEEAADAAGIVVEMLRRMLRPLVRLLVARQIHYPVLSRVLKSLYVEVATSDFALEDKRVMLSRLSLLTGIHRREVKRMLEEPAPGEAGTPPAITLGAQVVARWTGGPPWTDAAGRPRPLSRLAESEGEPGFHALVQSVSVDIHPRSLLDEWLRLGVVHVDDEGAVVLNVAAFVPVHGFEEKAHYVGRNLRDHLAAAAANLEGAQAPFLERALYYGSLPEDAIEELEALAGEAGQAALERVNARARSLKQADAERRARGEVDVAAPRRRITFGVFVYHDEAETDGGEGRDDER